MLDRMRENPVKVLGTKSRLELRKMETALRLTLFLQNRMHQKLDRSWMQRMEETRPARTRLARETTLPLRDDLQAVIRLEQLSLRTILWGAEMDATRTMLQLIKTERTRRKATRRAKRKG